MIKILFICHGNICRSPMAEFCFREMVEKAGLSGEIQTASAATSGEELGNPVYFLSPRLSTVLSPLGPQKSPKSSHRSSQKPSVGKKFPFIFPENVV